MRQFDTRVPTREQSDFNSHNVLVALRGPGGEPVEVKSLDINKVCVEGVGGRAAGIVLIGRLGCKHDTAYHFSTTYPRYVRCICG